MSQDGIKRVEFDFFKKEKRVKLAPPPSMKSPAKQVPPTGVTKPKTASKKVNPAAKPVAKPAKSALSQKEILKIIDNKFAAFQQSATKSDPDFKELRNEIAGGIQDGIVGFFNQNLPFQCGPVQSVQPTYPKGVLIAIEEFVQAVFTRYNEIPKDASGKPIITDENKNQTYHIIRLHEGVKATDSPTRKGRGRRITDFEYLFTFLRQNPELIHLEY